MKLKLIMLMVCLMFLMVGSGCEYQKVTAGNVGIKVNLLGGEKGVQEEEVGVGRYWLTWNEDMFQFPTFVQTYAWTQSETEGSPDNQSITFQTVKGLSVNADVGISYKINPEKVSSIFQTYRLGVDEITHVVLRNIVRDAFVFEACDKKVDQIYGAGKMQFIRDVEDNIKSQVSEIGINVSRIFLISDLRLPKQVQVALDLKIEATQRAEQRENEIREAEAEAAKLAAHAQGIADKVSIEATAQANANIKLAQSLTPALVQYEFLQKWNGALPHVMAGGSDSGMMFMLDTK